MPEPTAKRLFARAHAGKNRRRICHGPPFPNPFPASGKGLSCCLGLGGRALPKNNHTIGQHRFAFGIFQHELAGIAFAGDLQGEVLAGKCGL
mgnify:CR=1 FL=1|jgi:hypothetical protein